MIFTQFIRPDVNQVVEYPSDVSNVQIAGYRSNADQITALIDAGMRLQQAREDMYDYADDASIDDSVTDPTRSNDFDLADAAQIAHQIVPKVKSSKIVESPVKSVEPSPEKTEP